MESWGSPIDSLLDKIRLNCVQLTNRHIKNHLYYKGASAYFEVPTIILSVFAGSFSVGSDPFLHQELISVCLLYTSPSPRDQRGSRMPSSA